MNNRVLHKLEDIAGALEAEEVITSGFTDAGKRAIAAYRSGDAYWVAYMEQAGHTGDLAPAAVEGGGGLSLETGTGFVLRYLRSFSEEHAAFKAGSEYRFFEENLYSLPLEDDEQLRTDYERGRENIERKIRSRQLYHLYDQILAAREAAEGSRDKSERRTWEELASQLHMEVERHQPDAAQRERDLKLHRFRRAAQAEPSS